MCGLCGLYTPDGAAASDAYRRAVRAMTALLARRGPDGEGFWHEPEGRLALGHRRLAIVDLSPAGGQPMVAADGRSVIVYNGEIYNHPELRQELRRDGVAFRSRSDTEVLLAALERWGVEALPRLDGMFAFAWYRLDDGSLLLARDAFGVKPLYYATAPDGQGLAFASQLDAVLAAPWERPAPRLDALHLYLRLQHLPAPYTLFEGVHQLEPGSWLLAHRDGRLEARRWWSVPEDPDPDLTGEAAVDALADALDRAVARQRIADVPLGVFLSGGVDSPLIAAVARRQVGPELKAFTVANPGWWQDESEAAAAYATHLGVDHRLRPMTGDEALATVDEVAAAQHEPFADFSLLPTLWLSRFARGEVKVALSGDGGDELFFGYERPRSLLRDGAAFRLPWIVRLALYAAGRYGPLRRRSDVIVHRSPGDYYLAVNTRLAAADLERLAPGLPPFPDGFDLYRSPPHGDRRRLANDARRMELHGQLQRGLKKVDMASMHHGLEVRVPLLDRQVVEVAFRIDPRACLAGGKRKAVLRDLLARSVPAASIPEPKRGFAVPLAEWLRGPLRGLAEATLFDGPLFPEGVFERDALGRYWGEHLDGSRDHKWGVWTLLALQWWHRTHGRPAVRPAAAEAALAAD